MSERKYFELEGTETEENVVSYLKYFSSSTYHNSLNKYRMLYQTLSARPSKCFYLFAARIQQPGFIALLTARYFKNDYFKSLFVAMVTGKDQGEVAGLNIPAAITL